MRGIPTEINVVGSLLAMPIISILQHQNERCVTNSDASVLLQSREKLRGRIEILQLDNQPLYVRVEWQIA